MKKFLLAALACFCASAQAWDGQTNGKIDIVEVEGGLPFSFRVWLEGQPPLCGNTNRWAYVSHDNSNYQAYVSTLLAAKMSNTSVTIFANVAAQDFCQIGHIQIR